MLHLNDCVIAIANAAKTAGGRAVLVGGFVRDYLLGVESNDIDIEIFGLEAEKIESILADLGDVKLVGQSYGVYKLDNEIDVSLPRTETKTGPGHTGFNVVPNPKLDFGNAARRRDFTINAIGLDPLTNEILDPFRGQTDLARRRLAPVAVRTFVEDPLRVLRAAQFAARFEFSPSPLLVTVCTDIRHTLAELPGERLWAEWVKIMLKGKRPSAALFFLRDTKVDEVLFPEIYRLANCQQSPEWHPEGDVFVHTAMVLDAAASLRTGDPEHDLPLMFGALCHDFGKPTTTKYDYDVERWTARGHEAAGVEPTREFMERMVAPNKLVDQVCALVKDHLAPMHFVSPKSLAGPNGYKRLAERLEKSDTTIDMLAKVSLADCWGRSTPDSIARKDFTAPFLQKAADHSVVHAAERPIVQGRHLKQRGLKPGPHFGDIIKQCREIQYESGLTDPNEILDRVLAT